jgi:hypothetical protein
LKKFLTEMYGFILLYTRSASVVTKEEEKVGLEVKFLPIQAHSRQNLGKKVTETLQIIEVQKL